MKNRSFEYTPTDGSGGTFAVCYGDKETDLQQFVSSRNMPGKSPIYIVDKNLPTSYIKTAEKITELSAVNVIFVDTSQKTIDRVTAIWEQMVNTVPDIAVVIGGGTTSDLSGFACANYQRGIPRVLFPTTVLSMVDASIGGKSGIDFSEVKNSVGAIHYPLVVINYMPFLDTLDKSEYNSGFAEIIKASVLYNSQLFDTLYEYAKKSDNNPDTVLDIFMNSTKTKATLCEQKNSAKVSLLYGHSIAHAIERYESKHLRHGDCVGIGMTIEGAMACMLGIWDKTEWAKQQEIISFFQLPTVIPDYINLEDLAKKMELYKKLISTDAYLFSLPSSIGHVNNQETTYLTHINRKDMVDVLRQTLDWIRSEQ